jgi:hypothetical protein
MDLRCIYAPLAKGHFDLFIGLLLVVVEISDELFIPF